MVVDILKHPQKVFATGKTAKVLNTRYLSEA